MIYYFIWYNKYGDIVDILAYSREEGRQAYLDKVRKDPEAVPDTATAYGTFNKHLIPEGG